MSQLDFLFPVPALPPTPLAPSHSPGISPQSTQTLRDVLKDNHERWHIFFNQKRFHNHAPHRSIALWALGADASTIQQKYDKDCDYEKPAKKSPNPITRENFKEHLGDDLYFSAYCHFFAQYVQDHGIGTTLDHFLFSPEFNIGHQDRGTSHAEGPRMLNRFLAGVLHPIIHTGYGTEFGLPGMLVEGLAEAAVHHPSADLLGPLDLFSNASLPFPKDAVLHAAQGISNAFSQTVERFDNALDRVLPKSLHLDALNGGAHPLEDETTPRASDNPRPVRNSATRDDGPLSLGRRAIDILAILSHDRRLQVPSAGDENETYNWTIQHNATFVAEAMGDWGWSVVRDDDRSAQTASTIGRETEADCKIEEIAWLVVLLYGVGGWSHKRPDGSLNADFFFMHLVTSSLFLPSLVATISPSSKARLLRAYLATALTWYIARGKPSLDIDGFFSSPLDYPPSPSTSHSSPPESAGRQDFGDQSNHHGNTLWYAILQSATQHPDEHLTKAQRSLANWAGLLGGKTVTVMVQSGKGGETKLCPPRPRVRLGLEEDSGVEAAGLGMGMGIDPSVHVLRQGEALKAAEKVVARTLASSERHGAVEEANGNGGDGTGRADDMLGRHPPSAPDNRGNFEDGHVQLKPTPPFDVDAQSVSQNISGQADTKGSTRFGTSRSGSTETRGSRYSSSYQNRHGVRAVDMDGSLFLRTALMTARRMGWVGFPGGKEGDFWDFQGFLGKATDGNVDSEQRQRDRHANKGSCDEAGQNNVPSSKARL